LLLTIYRYNGSLKRALQAVYPAHDWGELRQTRPAGYWNSSENIQTFMKEIEKKLNISRVEDWKSVSIRQVLKQGGGGWLSKFVVYIEIFLLK
jgi:hypothetical protein